jgi:NADPH2:quinone reductase
MKAAVYDHNGGPEVFRVEEVPQPSISPYEVLVKVEVISIEGGDLISREIVPPATPSHIVGYQCAGKIVEVGSEVQNRTVGQQVVCVLKSGSHAEYVAAHSAMTWVLPDGMDLEIASAVPVAFATANECLFEVGKLQSGQSVLIHAGSGAIGLAMIQMAKRVGVKVFSTSSDDSKLERLKGYGVDVAINNVREDFVEVVKNHTNGRGVDVVVDSIAGKNLPRSLSSLKYAGRALFVGVSGRDRDGGLNPLALWPNCTSLHGIYMPRAFEVEYERCHAVVASLLEEISRGELKVDIDRVFPLSEVVGAYEHILSRKAFGRVLLRP